MVLSMFTIKLKKLKMKMDTLGARYNMGHYSLGTKAHGRRISRYTGLFISPSGISELDCATTKTDKTERSISIGRESLQVFFVLGALV